MFTNAKLLITGCTRPYGNAVFTRFLNRDVEEIRIFSRDEKKQHDIRVALKNSRVRYYLDDVRDTDSVEYAVTGLDYVFHVVALKQVPACEFYPMDGQNQRYVDKQYLSANARQRT